MKKSLPFFLLLSISISLLGQGLKGSYLVDSVYSLNLKNDFGEDPTRALFVYLPPGYQESARRYPVIYFLHGFGGNHLIPGMTDILDYAISPGALTIVREYGPNSITYKELSAISSLEELHRALNDIPILKSSGQSAA